MAPVDEIYRLFLQNPLISTDSRKTPQGSLFFAIKGETFDGNRFAADALNHGASYAIVDDPGTVTDQRFLLVENVLETLQKLALLYRNTLKAKIIAITGSNGKTTTKELISAVMASSFKLTSTQGNLNNHIGVPLTLLSVRKDDDFAVIEMGANHVGEIATLCNIARPDAGLITNIGKAHLEGFGGFQGVIKAKSELYQHLQLNNKTVFVNADDDLLTHLTAGMKSFSYGTKEIVDCQGEIQSSDPYLAVRWSSYAKNGLVKTNLYGNYNFSNILAAISIGVFYGVAQEKINHAIAGYIPANNRSQIVKTASNILVLDAYNANPSSMKEALGNFDRKNAVGKMVILGDMAELGEYTRKEHEQVVMLLSNMNFDKVILVGKSFAEAAGTGKALCFENIEEVRKYLKNNPVDNMTILLKGSRIMKLETLRDLL